MIRKFFKIIFLILIFIIISCEKEKEITSPNLPHGKINITTDKEIYYWENDVGIKRLVIEGELNNYSKYTFLSNVRDPFGPSDKIFFAGGSDGKLEKYNNADNKWYEKDILEFLIEGTSVMQIKPAKIYPIHASLFINTENDRAEIGMYRLKLAYYEILDESRIKPYYDHSNSFEIN